MLDIAVPPQWKRQWEDLLVQLRDPFKLRVTVVGGIAAVGLMAIYQPLSAEIKIVSRDLKVAEDRLTLVRETDQLRKARSKLLENLPADGDINFWSEHLLSGIRESGVVLKTLDSSYRKTKVGKLVGAYYDIEVAGTSQQIHSLMGWIEANKYFSRIVKLRFKAEREAVDGKMTVAVLVAPEKSPAKAKPAAKAPAAEKGDAARATPGPDTKGEAGTEAKTGAGAADGVKGAQPKEARHGD